MNPTKQENQMQQGQAQEPITVTRSAIVRAAVAARTPEGASSVNDMIALHLGYRHERYIADRVNNLGVLTTAGDYDHKSLEPITNMHDTVLELFAFRRYGNIDQVSAKNPREAVDELMNGMTDKEKADLARVDIYEAEPPAKQTKRVTLTFRDKGCGIGNADIPGSIFYAGSPHKDSYPWMSGAFGLGATTCYPNSKAVVLVTRRAPELLKDGEEDVISVAVAEWHQHAKGRGICYLVDNAQNLPLAIPASEVPEFEPGTHLAFISYGTRGFHTERNDRTSMEFLINTRLWDGVLPVRLMNNVVKDDHPKDHQGRRRQFESPRVDRQDFRAVMPFRLGGTTYRIPVEVHYFSAGPSGDKGGMRNFIAQGHSSVFLANGQSHKHWQSLEMKHRANMLPKLYDRVFVIAYLDEIPVGDRTTKLFSPDRVDFVDTEEATRLQDALAAFLNNWEELRELNNNLVRQALENRTSGRSTVRIAERIKENLAIRGGFQFSGGDGSGDDSDRPKKKWAGADLWPDPTALEGPASINVVAGKTKFFHYFLNATDDFFASGRGRLEIVCDHERIGDAELVVGTELHNGLVRVSLLVPEDIEVGTEATILACLGDWMKSTGGIGDDHQWQTKLTVVEPNDDSGKKKAKPKKKSSEQSGGTMVAVVWGRIEDFSDDWNGGVPGHIEPVEAAVLAETVEGYKALAKLGSQQIPTIYLNEDYSRLKKYEQWRVKSVGTQSLDDARDRYAVGIGVGMLVLYERERKRIEKGEDEQTDTVTERQAVAQGALAMMPEMDKLMKEAGLEREQ